MATISSECQICGLPAHGVHFSVLTCRACSAFFRRTVHLRLEYICRNGDEACDIGKAARCLCRRCRYLKCLRLGMNPAGVQSLRDLNRNTVVATARHHLPGNRKDPRLEAVHEVVPKKGADSGMATTSLSSSSEAERASSCEMASDHNHSSISSSSSHGSSSLGETGDHQAAEEADSVRESIRDIFSKCPRMPSAPQRSHVHELLVAYGHLTTLRTRINSLFPLPFPHTRWGNITVSYNFFAGDTRMELIKAEIPIVAEFCCCIRQFAELEDGQKWLIFKTFWLQFLMLDRLFRTYEHELEDSEAVQFHGEGLVDQELRARFVAFHRRQLLEPMASLRPDTVEWMVMVAQLMWNPNFCFNGLSDTTRAIGTAVREEIMSELHEHYTTSGRANYASRISTIMDILCSINTVSLRKREDIAVLRLFTSIRTTSMAELLDIQKDEII